MRAGAVTQHSLSQAADLGQACLPTLEAWVQAAFPAGTDKE